MPDKSRLKVSVLILGLVFLSLLEFLILAHIARHPNFPIDNRGFGAFWDQTDLRDSFNSASNTVDGYQLQPEPVARLANYLVSRTVATSLGNHQLISLLALWGLFILITWSLPWISNSWMSAYWFACLWIVSPWPLSFLGQASFAPLGTFLAFATGLLLVIAHRSQRFGFYFYLLAGHVFAVFFWSQPNTLPILMALSALLLLSSGWNRSLLKEISPFLIFALIGSFAVLAVSGYQIENSYFHSPSKLTWAAAFRILLFAPGVLLVGSLTVFRQKTTARWIVWIFLAFISPIILLNLPLTGEVLFPLLPILLATTAYALGQEHITGKRLILLVGIVVLYSAWGATDIPIRRFQNALSRPVPEVLSHKPIPLGRNPILPAQITPKVRPQIAPYLSGLPERKQEELFNAPRQSVAGWKHEFMKAGLTQDQAIAATETLFDAFHFYIVNKHTKELYFEQTGQQWPTELDGLVGHTFRGTKNFKQAIREASKTGANYLTFNQFIKHLKTDIPGNDFRRLELPPGSESLCAKACSNSPICRAYTYETNIPNGNSRCNLKSFVKEKRPNICCESASKSENTLFQVANALHHPLASLPEEWAQIIRRENMIDSSQGSLKEEAFSPYFAQSYPPVPHSKRSKAITILGPYQPTLPSVAATNPQYLDRGQILIAQLQGSKILGLEFLFLDELSAKDFYFTIDKGKLLKFISNNPLSKRSSMVSPELVDQIAEVDFYETFTKQAIEEALLLATFPDAAPRQASVFDLIEQVRPIATGKKYSHQQLKAAINQRVPENQYLEFPLLDFPNNTILSKKLPLESLEDCQRLCTQNPSCEGITYEHVIEEEFSRCNLKRYTGAIGLCPNCTSAIKQRVFARANLGEMGMLINKVNKLPNTPRSYEEIFCAGDCSKSVGNNAIANAITFSAGSFLRILPGLVVDNSLQAAAKTEGIDLSSGVLEADEIKSNSRNSAVAFVLNGADNYYTNQNWVEKVFDAYPEPEKLPNQKELLEFFASRGFRTKVELSQAVRDKFRYLSPGQVQQAVEWAYFPVEWRIPQSGITTPWVLPELMAFAITSHTVSRLTHLLSQEQLAALESLIGSRYQSEMELFKALTAQLSDTDALEAFSLIAVVSTEAKPLLQQDPAGTEWMPMRPYHETNNRQFVLSSFWAPLSEMQNARLFHFTN